MIIYEWSTSSVGLSVVLRDRQRISGFVHNSERNTREKTTIISYFKNIYIVAVFQAENNIFEKISLKYIRHTPTKIVNTCGMIDSHGYLNWVVSKLSYNSYVRRLPKKSIKSWYIKKLIYKNVGRRYKKSV